MPFFTDAKKRSWQIEVDFPTVERLRADEKFDLLDHEKVIKMLLDPVQIYKLLWHLVEPEAVKLSVDAADFGKSLGPDRAIFAEAKRCLERALIDFFHQCQQPDKALAVEELQAAVSKGLEQFEATAQERMAGVRERSDRLIQTKLQSTFGGLEDSLDRMLEQEAVPGAS